MKKIILNQEMCDYLEMLHYEVESRKDLLTYALKNNMAGTDSFKEYQEEYRDFYMQYQVAKREMEDKYITPLYPVNYGWNLNFSTKEITINEGVNEN